MGYVHSKQGIMSFGSLGIYLGSPKQSRGQKPDFQIQSEATEYHSFR